MSNVELLIRLLLREIRRRKGEKGVTVVEYIGLAAVVLVMLAVIFSVLKEAADEIGKAIADSFNQQIDEWNADKGWW